MKLCVDCKHRKEYEGSSGRCWHPHIGESTKSLVDDEPYEMWRFCEENRLDGGPSPTCGIHAIWFEDNKQARKPMSHGDGWP